MYVLVHSMRSSLPQSKFIPGRTYAGSVHADVTVVTGFWLWEKRRRLMVWGPGNDGAFYELRVAPADWRVHVSDLGTQLPKRASACVFQIYEAWAKAVRALEDQ